MIKSAVLLGSFMPDIPLFVLSFLGYFYYHHWMGWSINGTFSHIYGELYFFSPLWMAGHNLLHSPLILTSVLLVLVYLNKRTYFNQWLFWFFSACFLHSLVDIFTHVDDGPLLLFPLNWTTRFSSPISYWDTRFYGGEFMMFEAVLDLVLLLYLMLPPFIEKFIKKESESV